MRTPRLPRPTDMKSKKAKRRSNRRGFSARLPMSEQLESRLVLTASGFPGNDCPPDLDLSGVGELQIVVGQPLNIDLYANGATAVDLDLDSNPTGDTIRLVLDPDVGTDTPVGATITTDGVFSWTPTAGQVGTFQIPVIAIDQGTPSLADVEFLTVVVSATGDQAPSVDLNGPAAGVGFSTVLTENGGPVAATDPALTITDADSANLVSATITLTNFQDGADEVLAVDTTGTSIAASSYNPATGELTLTGSDTLANYITVLQSLTYDNTSENPTILDRTIQITVNDGGLSSPIVISTISIVAENDAPTVDLNGAPAGIDFAATFTEGDGATSIVDAGVVVDDVDSENLESATITLTNLIDTDDEFLAVDISGTSIIQLYDASTGILTLSGIETLANYQLVLSTLVYNNTSVDPDETDRNVEVIVNDGTTDSATATITITVQSVNEAPDLAPIDDQTAQLGTVFQLTVTANDPDGDDLTFQLDHDGAGANIPALATITKTSDTTALIEWTPTAGDGAGPFTFVVLVTDDASTPLADSETFVVTLTTSPPEVDLNGEGTGIDFAASFTEGDGPVSVVDVTATVTDPDSTNIESATITLTNLIDTDDEFLAVDVSGTSINQLYDASTGILTLSGSELVADYQQVIRTLTYNNVSENPDTTDRTIEVVVNDGTDDSATATISVTVEGVNDAPNLESIDDQTAQLDTVFQITVTATDPDGDDLTFQLDHDGAGANIPALATITKTSDTTALIEWTPTAGDGAGPFTFVVLVTDDASTPLADSETFVVTLLTDPPEVDLNGEGAGIDFAASFTEGDGPVSVVDVTATVTDPDSTNIESATITLNNLIDTDDEFLAVDVSGTSINQLYDASTGILTLSGSELVADYQQVIRTLTYNNVSEDPDITDRAIEVIVNDGVNNSAVANITVAVAAENDSPQLTLPAPYDSGSPVEVDIDTEVTFDILVDDPDHAPISRTYILDLDGSGIPLEIAQPTLTTPSEGVAGGTFSWTPSQTGTFTITIIVLDGDGAPDQETFILTVVDPIAASGLEGEPFDTELNDLALMGLMEDEI
ncbi:putative Ig domain-containing protein [Bremerella alba]|uniref:Cadherin domain-containing protein n=1 Tax=Bremerella alba TaxID=980252 RepID=A0A7V8V5Y3_9BACT|nr:Ig-like domain-containing protein [Bremerella alba]MBA2115440.1 hypothetical protein [Bremerella alba]